MKKRMTIVLSILAVGLGAAYIGVGNYFYNFALKANDEKEFMEGNPHLEESIAVVAEVAEAAELADSQFELQHEASAMSIISDDELQLNLHADYYANGSDNHKWAIAVHGYTGSADGMTRYIRNFYEQGFHVVAPDLRGHGRSEGEYIGMGWHDRLDLLKWIDEIISLDPDAEIALFGISMGGATVMMTSGEDLPSNVKVIVEDCGYSSVSDVFVYQLDDLFGLPEFPVLNAANTVTKMRAGFDLYEASAVRQVAKSKKPMLFIHGNQDTFVPYEMLDEVYEAANVEKNKLIIEGAGHGEAEKIDPDSYWNAVWSFVGKYI
ncbi:alpha/beta hydrolase [Ureibacillus sinduriensis]|uniref:Alpha/beta hydrolase n=1 Tax=Ureibacillus sinduriensis BLB-1 = JCM 15800 TaxID=1384057 RepID=A0A0A3HT58_9BACL|nr:alpha/beta fold hydrolase [Ureibacillus sinduriensis]KGR74385.1 alpha/beta hydrolase [Ureibacillus sinduriensis BLB-1 = JCM 15800]